MLKKFIILLVALSFLPLSAGAFQMSSPINTGTIKLGEYANFQFTLKNDDTRSRVYNIDVAGPHPERIFVDVSQLMLNKWESGTFNVGFYPGEAGSFQYTVTVYRADKPEDSKSVIIYLSVLQQKEPEIRELSARKVGDELVIDASVYSYKKGTYDFTFEVSDSLGNAVKTIALKKEISGLTEFSENMNIAGIDSGDYYLKASVPSLGLYKETTFSVDPMTNVVKTKKVVSSLFADEVIITVENKGNSEEDLNINEEVPANLYTSPIDSPDSEYYNPDKNAVTYSWEFTGLAVGQQAEIRYVVERWKNYAGWIAVFLGIVGLLGLAGLKTSQPKIRKYHARRRSNQHLVVLEIKGSMTKKLNNVIVKDRVTPLARVSEEFEGPKPVVLNSDSGTELIWRLGTINPRSDSILLTYKVNPLIEANLKMPRAYLAYRDENDKKFRVFSGQLVLK